MLTRRLLAIANLLVVYYIQQFRVYVHLIDNVTLLNTYIVVDTGSASKERVFSYLIRRSSLVWLVVSESLKRWPVYKCSVAALLIGLWLSTKHEVGRCHPRRPIVENGSRNSWQNVRYSGPWINGMIRKHVVPYLVCRRLVNHKAASLTRKKPCKYLYVQLRPCRRLCRRWCLFVVFFWVSLITQKLWSTYPMGTLGGSELGKTRLTLGRDLRA